MFGNDSILNILSTSVLFMLIMTENNDLSFVRMKLELFGKNLETHVKNKKRRYKEIRRWKV